MFFPHFGRRCLFARVVPVRQMAHSAGMMIIFGSHVWPDQILTQGADRNGRFEAKQGFGFYPNPSLSLVRTRGSQVQILPLRPKIALRFGDQTDRLFNSALGAFVFMENMLEGTSRKVDLIDAQILSRRHCLSKFVSGDLIGEHLRVGSSATDAHCIFGPSNSGEFFARP
jgi:hypothetical protein